MMQANTQNWHRSFSMSSAESLRELQTDKLDRHPELVEGCKKGVGK